AGQTLQLTAMGTYSDGTQRDISSAAAWASSTLSVATVNAAGLAAGVAVGSTTITASANGISGTATIKVSSAVVLSIAISSKLSYVGSGQTRQFTATATYSDGQAQGVRAIWSSSNTGVATIDTTGLATGGMAGTSTITATYTDANGNSFNNTAPLNVLP